MATDSDAGGDHTEQPSGDSVDRLVGLSINEDGGNDTYLEANDGGAILGGLDGTVTGDATFLGASTTILPALD